MLDGVSKLAKLLASDELKTRRKGHKYVQELLRLKPGPDSCKFQIVTSLSLSPDKISYKDVLGICKGLYYSLWMQDKPLLQEEIESKIVRLISTISTVEIRSMYIIAMFETLAREWDNLDVWRTDKFMMVCYWRHFAHLPFPCNGVRIPYLANPRFLRANPFML